MSRNVFVGALAAVVLTSGVAHAQSLVAYQGRLEDATSGPLTDDFDFQFALYSTPTGGTYVWSEEQTLVPVAGGAFTVLLGSATPIPNSLWSEYPDLYLSIAVRPNETPPVSYTPMQNRQRIAFVPRSVQAQSITRCQVRATSATNNAVAGTFGPITAYCQAGEKLMAGGFEGPTLNGMLITSSYPDMASDGWIVYGYNGTGSTRTVKSYAICCQ